jgi:hypothetical protein
MNKTEFKVGQKVLVEGKIKADAGPGMVWIEVPGFQGLTAFRESQLTPIDRCEKNEVNEKEAKDQAYSERNQLVAFLSRLYPSHLKTHPATDTDWESDWRTIVCIHSPAGQLTWHIHDSEVRGFEI